MEEKILDIIKAKDTKESYHQFQLLEARASASNGLYPLFDEFVPLLRDEKASVRIRSFRLLCSMAQWDNEEKLEQRMSELLSLLDDGKPTIVRQALAALRGVILFKPQLSEAIETKLDSMDTTKFKDSMKPLIEKDILGLKEMFLNL